MESPALLRATDTATESPFQGVVRVPSWRDYPWLLHGFSTRLGGTSSTYGQGDLNLGWTASDDPRSVAANRRRFLREIAAEKDSVLVTIQQFHSNLIHSIGDATPLVGGNGESLLRGDGLITNKVGICLGILTADCVPVLIADLRQRCVGAFHAGWRGTLGRIVERGVHDFCAQYGSQSAAIVAAIGPCIAACCCAVGSEVRAQYESQFIYSKELFVDASEGNQVHLDLVAANRRQLVDAGLREENISVAGECTACARTGSGRRKYFSHRAERGFTGRMLSVIGVASG